MSNIIDYQKSFDERNYTSERIKDSGRVFRIELPVTEARQHTRLSNSTTADHHTLQTIHLYPKDSYLKLKTVSNCATFLPTMLRKPLTDYAIRITALIGYYNEQPLLML